MTKTDGRSAILLALAQRQRRFEWELARDEQTRAAARLVAGRTHEMLNLVQVVQLATFQLETMVGEAGKEFVADLHKTADDAQREQRELMAVARPDVEISKGDPVGAAVAAALASLREAIPVDIHLATSADTCTRCTAAELEHVLIGLVLDIIDDPPGVPTDPIALHVRERTIDRKRWIEIVRASGHTPRNDRFELRAVTAVVERGGGELATSERRGGGVELVVALPVVD